MIDVTIRQYTRKVAFHQTELPARSMWTASKLRNKSQTGETQQASGSARSSGENKVITEANKALFIWSLGSMIHHLHQHLLLVYIQFLYLPHGEAVDPEVVLVGLQPCAINPIADNVLHSECISSILHGVL